MITRYVCEQCGSEYNSPELATQCEKNHTKPDKIQFKYNDGFRYPACIFLTFEGEIVTYAVMDG